MAVRVFIVEDEVLVAENLRADLQDLGFIVSGHAISSNECIALLEQLETDVILMDIQIKGERNGIELATLLNQSLSIPIIYLTSNTDPITMRKALATKPHSFISKPYTIKDVQAAIEIAFSSFNQQTAIEVPASAPMSVFVKCGDLYHRVQIDAILYVEASGSYCIIATKENDYVLSMNLHAFNDKMLHPNFIRVHRSFLVNIDKVDKFDSQSLYINEREIPISKANRETVFHHLHKL